MKKFLKKFSLGKSLLILTLSFSNLFVLFMLFSLSSGDQTYRFFSKSMDGESLMKRIQSECAESFKQVVEGERKSFICNSKVDGKHKGADYKFKTRFKVSKKEDGTVGFTNISGKFIDGEDHLSEATFCNNCFENQEFADSSASDVTEFMKEVAEHIADKMAEKAKEISDQAYEEYDKANKKRAAARIKEKKCEGVWDKESESFKEFEDRKEKADCWMARMDGKPNSLEIEELYHTELKRELWKLYLEEGNEEELAKILNSFDDDPSDPYRYAISVRSSANLLEEFTRWKRGFDTLETDVKKERLLKNFLHSANVVYGSQMTKDQFKQDLYYLNQGFDDKYKKVIKGISLQIDHARNNLKEVPKLDYSAISKEAQGLL